MRFVLIMAAREMRSSWKRLLFFFICIAIGVGAIVALRSVIQSVRRTFDGEARALIAADAIINSNQALEPTLVAKIDERLSAAGAVSTRSVETATMVRPADREGGRARMVELRAVEAPFPYYGLMKLGDGVPYQHALLSGFGVLVRPELLAQLDLKVGDGLRIGSQRFVIRGVIESEPGRRLGAFSIGPRVFVDLADLEKAGLLGFGSRASVQRLLKVPEPAFDKLVVDLRADFAGEYREAAIVQVHRGSDGRGFRAGRELSQPGRPGHRDSRRHRRLERDARVRAAEDEEHRRAEMPRRPIVAIAGRLRGAGGRARLCGKRARRGPGRHGDAGDSLVPRRRDTWHRHSVRPDDPRGAARPGHRHARLAAVLAGAAARRPARQAVAAAARRGAAAARRSHPDRRDGGRGRRAGRPHGVAGRLVANRRHGGGRFRRDGDRAAPGRHGVDSRARPAGEVKVVCAQARGVATAPPRQPDAHRAARGGAGQLLHHRRALAAAEPDRAVRGEHQSRIARHVPARHPAGPGRAGARGDHGPPGTGRGAAAPAAGAAGPGGGRRRQGDAARRLRGRARPRRARA